MKSNHAKNAHKSGHHHHANEMAHHRMRDAHKARHEAHRKSQHAPMHEHGATPHHLIGGAVSDNHQQGIERVKQRPGAMETGQHGSMADGWRHDRRGE